MMPPLWVLWAIYDRCCRIFIGRICIGYSWPGTRSHYTGFGHNGCSDHRGYAERSCFSWPAMRYRAIGPRWSLVGTAHVNLSWSLCFPAA